MSTHKPEPKKLPKYVFLSSEIAQLYAEQSRKGVYNLTPSEMEWRDRYEFLEGQGYLLRPRYHPKWEPSWVGANMPPDLFEDSIRPRNIYVLDATRTSNNTRVAIKTVKSSNQEIRVSRLVASLGGAENHCVSAIEVLPDPLDDQRSLLIMPYLRPYDDPELQAVGDVVDFAEQMLKSLAFLHRIRIAHRDIAPPNIMMDGRPLFPDGHHPVCIHLTEDAIDDATPLPRIDHPVTYYYIDFGLSSHFDLEASSKVIGKVGRDMEIPELSSEVPYDAYKADIYALGNIFDKDFLKRFSNVEFLRQLVECMKQREPDLRPPADELLRMFGQVRALVPEPSIRWRLVERSEQPYEKLFNDTVAVVREGFTNIKRMVG